MSYATSEEYIEENPRMPRSHAVRMMKQHSIALEDFFAEFGEQSEYDSEDVIGWLGY